MHWDSSGKARFALKVQSDENPTQESTVFGGLESGVRYNSWEVGFSSLLGRGIERVPLCHDEPTRARCSRPSRVKGQRIFSFWPVWPTSSDWSFLLFKYSIENAITIGTERTVFLCSLFTTLPFLVPRRLTLKDLLSSFHKILSPFSYTGLGTNPIFDFTGDGEITYFLNGVA